MVFKIKTLDTLSLNDTFSNQAGIYFDYNAPIITNEYTTTVSENLNVGDLQNAKAQIKLSPNPATDYFQLNSKEMIKKVEVFDSNGRLMKTFMGDTPQYSITSLKEGVYMVKVYTNEGIAKEKLIKK